MSVPTLPRAPRPAAVPAWDVSPWSVPVEHGARSVGSARTWLIALAVAVVAGFMLGDADVLLQKALAYPWANLANSSAVWALAAFAYGAWRRRANVITATGAVVLLVTAVVSYYLTAAVVLSDDIAVLWAPTSLGWMVFGVLAGLAFGTMGAWTREADWRRGLAAALGGSICFAEAAVVLIRLATTNYGFVADQLETAVLTAALGVVVLVAAARALPVIVRAVIVAVPLTVLGVVGFAATGFLGSLV